MTRCPPIAWIPSMCTSPKLPLQWTYPPSIARSCPPGPIFMPSPAETSISKRPIRPEHSGPVWKPSLRRPVGDRDLDEVQVDRLGIARAVERFVDEDHAARSLRARRQKHEHDHEHETDDGRERQRVGRRAAGDWADDWWHAGLIVDPHGRLSPPFGGSAHASAAEPTPEKRACAAPTSPFAGEATQGLCTARHGACPARFSRRRPSSCLLQEPTTDAPCATSEAPRVLPEDRGRPSDYRAAYGQPPMRIGPQTPRFGQLPTVPAPVATLSRRLARLSDPDEDNQRCSRRSPAPA